LISAAEGVASQGLRPGDGMRGYLQLIMLKVGAFGSVLLLAQYRWWLGVGVAVAAMIVRRHILTVWFQTAEALNGDIAELRRVEYLRDLALRPAAAKETRIFSLGPWLAGQHQKAWATAMEPVWKRRERSAWRMTVVDSAVLVIAVAAGVPIVVGLASGDLSVARAVVLCGALTAIIGLGGFLPNADFPIRYACLALPPMLELERRLADRGQRERPAIASGGAARGRLELSGIVFHYPGSDRAVLNGLDLAIEPGSKVALVGANGAGKSTIIKLLARLYEPTSGTITVSGTNLADFDVNQWRKQIGVIFQDFARYELPARDNVGFGAIHLRDDAEALDEAAGKAGLLDLIGRMPRGWDSTLSRAYEGGADLSGGQWQRVALARALMAVRGGAQVLVLDEPTAALDVRAEAEFYERFMELAAETTTIIVSHRFSTVRRAERICVLSDGCIIEDGSHEQLVAAGGVYARMFRLQAVRITGE
jgi:ATP-binding cassette subfamily B protein